MAPATRLAIVRLTSYWAALAATSWTLAIDKHSRGGRAIRGTIMRAKRMRLCVGAPGPIWPIANNCFSMPSRILDILINRLRTLRLTASFLDCAPQSRNNGLPISLGSRRGFAGAQNLSSPKSQFWIQIPPMTPSCHRAAAPPLPRPLWWKQAPICDAGIHDDDAAAVCAVVQRQHIGHHIQRWRPMIP